MRRFVPSPQSYGASSCYDTYQAEYDKYLKLMWDTPITVFEKDGGKRGGYEKKANEAKEKQQACGEGATDMFSAGATAQKLWVMSYKDRKLDASGIFGPEDTIIAVAKGMQPSGLVTALEDRAVIKGGLTALNLAGLSSVNPASLMVTVANSKKDDDALIVAAGLTPGRDTGKDLSTAAAKVRAEVSKHGDNLKKAAWGIRGIYILGTLPGFQAAKAVVATGLGIAGAALPILYLVSAVIAAHSAISSSIASNVTNEMNGYVKKGMEGFAAELAAVPAVVAPVAKKTTKRAAPSRRGAQRTEAPGLQSGLGGVPTWGWVAGGVVLLGGLYALSKR